MVTFVSLAAMTIISSAQTFSTLASFDGTNGSLPALGALVQGTDGNFYGTTTAGGTSTQCNGGCGTVFKMSPSGVLTMLYSFCSQPNCTDGKIPYATLVQASDGNFYGVTFEGGGNGDGCDEGCGTLFKITSGGTLTTLYSFCSQASCADGGNPEDSSGLTQGSDGNLYGATATGGTGLGLYGSGTIFKISLGGTLTTVYNFCPDSRCSSGYHDNAGLVQGSNGNFYGVTYEGGYGNSGTVFTISPQGKEATIYTFCLDHSTCSDGAEPIGLISAPSGNFYGVTGFGGAHGAGTIFEITPAGALTTLYSFCAQPNCADGLYPVGGLALGTDGNVYGTTLWGGIVGCYDEYGCGTAFKVTPAGELTTLHTFCTQTGCPDGYDPEGTLMQATNGAFYGTTNIGGADSLYGTVFRLADGLKPFVETRPVSGRAGASVIILGSNLMGSINVSFNGTTASFTVVSRSEIKAVVPSGATTGPVVVTTPGGALTSNVNFRILQ
jgi:uncharacterized repeat protein (TIGR03803 family)